MTDEDKNILELAAKAAGIKYDQEASKPNPVSGAWFGLWLTYDREPTEYDRLRWNPLTDDGDTLRLAVKLRLSIIQEEEFVLGEYFQTVEVMSEEREDGSRICIMQSFDDDPMTATRRAIVRAAAEIGKAMP